MTGVYWLLQFVPVYAISSYSCGCQKDDCDPVVGIWPNIAKRLHRPKLKPQQSVKPKETFHSAFQMDDMSSLLIACSSMPLRLRGNDQSLFSSAQKEIASNLQPIPEWLKKEIEMSNEERINFAHAIVNSMEFVRTQGKAGKDLQLEITAKGSDWLALSPKKRLKSVFNIIIKWGNQHVERFCAQ